jgi:hypothetical protein
MAAVLCGLVAVVALTQSGCLRTSANETAPSRGSSPAPAREGEERDDNDELQQPLLQEFGRALDDAPDLGSSDRDEAWEILREADPILTQIKEENRKGIEAANQPPKLQPQRSKKPKQAEDAPETTDQQQPET